LFLSFEVAELKILDEIQDFLDPKIQGQQIHLKRNKLKVYGPGGHFKEHVDTPRERNLVGSLVICLPLTPEGFSGGELKVKLKNDVDWSAFQLPLVVHRSLGLLSFVIHFMRFSLSKRDIELLLPMRSYNPFPPTKTSVLILFRLRLSRSSSL
jgi:hypothetical protein